MSSRLSRFFIGRSTSYQGGRSIAECSLKRYRYVGKERDDESGFIYIGARYYCPWLARWLEVDPLESKYTPESPYNYCHNNPVIFTDDTGLGVEITGIKRIQDGNNRVVNPDNTAQSTSTNYYREINATIYIYSNDSGINTDNLKTGLQNDLNAQYNNGGSGNAYFGIFDQVNGESTLIQLRFNINVVSLKTPEAAIDKLSMLSDNEKAKSNFFYVNNGLNDGWASEGTGMISANTDVYHQHHLSHEFGHILGWSMAIYPSNYVVGQQPNGRIENTDHMNAVYFEGTDHSGSTFAQTNVSASIRNPRRFVEEFSNSIMGNKSTRHVTQKDISSLGRKHQDFTDRNGNHRGILDFRQKDNIEIYRNYEQAKAGYYHFHR